MFLLSRWKVFFVKRCGAPFIAKTGGGAKRYGDLLRKSLKNIAKRAAARMSRRRPSLYKRSNQTPRNP